MKFMLHSLDSVCGHYRIFGARLQARNYTIANFEHAARFVSVLEIGVFQIRAALCKALIPKSFAAATLPLVEGMPVSAVFTHLQLFTPDGRLTNAAILLFGKEPQRFLISSEVKCVQWYGTERHKPMLSYQIYQTKHIEKFGTGFTDLVADCRVAGLCDPVVDDSRTEFTITIFRPANKMKINEDKNENKSLVSSVNDAEIIAFIIENPTLSVKDIANKMQIKLGVMRSAILRLKREKGLKHIGSKKSGHWAFQSVGAPIP